MLRAIVHLLLIALAFILIDRLLPGVTITSFGIAILAAIVFGLVNLIVKPLVTLLTLPLNFLTLGLFSFIINALMFGLTALLVPGFSVNNFITALIAALLLAILTAVINMVTQKKSYA